MSTLPVELLPPPVASYVQTGAPVGRTLRDVETVSNQVPRLVWGAAALGAAYMAYKRWRHQ